MQLQQYELIRPIGHGGMGLVFEGRKLSPIKGTSGTRSHESVAIKLIPQREIQIEEKHAHALFQREAVYSWRISGEHENLVTTYDYGVSSQGYRYIVMALIDGVSLSEIMSGHERLPFPVIRRIALDVLCGLSYLHRRKVIHRDVSSANVLIGRNGSVKVTDFGLIKPAFQSGSEVFRGTATYAAPEAFGNGTLGPMADLFSLGVLLYRMVSGRYPYGDDFDAVVAAIQRGKPPPPVPEETPDDLTQVIDGLIPLKPSDRRWSRANDVIAFLDELQEPVALEEDIEEVVEMRSPAAERGSTPTSLPELGWPFAEPEAAAPVAEIQRPTRQPKRVWRWLPWALLPLAFVAGFLVMFMRSAEQPQNAQVQAPQMQETSVTEPAPEPTSPAVVNEMPAPRPVAENPRDDGRELAGNTTSTSSTEVLQQKTKRKKPRWRSMKKRHNEPKETKIHGYTFTEYPLR